MDSILTSIKKMLGIEEEYTHFDADLIMHINSAISVLTQVGVGPPAGFRIEDDTAVWSDFIGEAKNVDAVISFVYLRVKLLFDPPSSSSVMEMMKQQADEFLWRINVTVDPGKTEGKEE